MHTFLKKAFLMMLVIIYAISLPSFELKAKAQTQLAIRSVDVMKYTKDVMTNQPSDATINNIVSALAAMPITHVAISIPMDSSASYPAGNKPFPSDAYIFTQKWADAIHSKGLNIIWRGTWSGIEGIYGFPRLTGTNRFPTGTAASAATDGSNTWLGKNYQYISSNPNFFKSGDLWAPLPERTEGIFQDSTSFLPYTSPGIQTNYNNFFNDLKQTSEAAFAKIGKNVTVGQSANNYTEVESGWLGQSLFDSNGVVAIDYYGNNHTPTEMDYDIRKMASMHGHPVFLQEWADYWNDDGTMTTAQRTQYLQSMFAEMQTLLNDGVLSGFNYWGGWDNSTEGILLNSSGNFQLNYRGNLLSQFFSANAPAVTPPPAPAPTPTPTPTSTPALTCPTPGINSFTGCYYSNQDLSHLTLIKNDASVNFDWGGQSPDPQIPVDRFSASWQGIFQFKKGNYTFSMTSDDGSRLYVDGHLILNQWTDHAANTLNTSLSLSPGSHTIKMDYYEAAGGAVAKLSWWQRR